MQLVGNSSFQRIQMEDNDVPNYAVHAFQIHQDQGVAGNDGEIDITYREKNFPVGSIFSFPIQSTTSFLQASDNEWNEDINPASFHIGEGAQLTIDTLVLDPSSALDGSASLFMSTDVDPDFICICPAASFSNGRTMVTSLGLSVTGPASVHFALVHFCANHDAENKADCLETVNVFGKVQAVSSDVLALVSIAKKMTSEVEGQIMSDKQTTIVQGDENGSNGGSGIVEMIDSTEKVSGKKKRKLNNPEERSTSNEKSSSPDVSVEVQKLTKKQRRKLAKQKEKQLQDAVAKEFDHSVTNTTAKESAPDKKISLTRPRMIKGGIVIQDILHGSGASVKMGRKVSINYIGTFPETGKVFDKNMGKPLTFRVGTGEVIKGLDRGIEGMKINGERVIQIPSDMGYGSKGAGDKIPPNSKLCFTVHLKSIGGR